LRDIKIDTEYITLQQLLKLEAIVSSGGMVKAFLSEEVVLVNGELESRRGRKLYPGDVVDIKKHEVLKIIK
jgi:S4 domain protein YaaA